MAIDYASREVTLHKETGEIFSVVAGAEVRNLKQVKVGDKVVARYEEGVVAAIRPSATKTRSVVERTDTSRAEPGQKPAGMLQKTIELSATVQAIDAVKRHVTLQGPEKLLTLPVAEDVDLKGVKIGDQVHVLYRRTLAISVEPAS